MFSAMSFIASHLRTVPQFQSWDVRDGLSIVARDDYPAVDVRIGGAGVVADGVEVVKVSPSIAVSLIAERGEGAAEELDAGFEAAIAALHGLLLKDRSGRTWSWAKLVAVRELDVVSPYVGCELIFTTDSEYQGQQCDC